MLTRLHTRQWAYGALTLSVLGLEAFLGWRAEEMYAALLGTFASPLELLLVRLVIGVSVAVFGFVLATHRQYGLEAQLERIKDKESRLDGFDANALRRHARRNLFLAMAFVIIHDIAGAIYLILASQPGLTLTTFEANVVLDLQLIMATLGMTAIVFIPFLIGHFTLALAESLPAEHRQRYAVEGLAYLRDGKLAAVQKVANETRKMSAEGALLLLERSAGHDLAALHDPLIREFQEELALLVGVRKAAPTAHAAPRPDAADLDDDEQPERVTVRPEPTETRIEAMAATPALPERRADDPPDLREIITDAEMPIVQVAPKSLEEAIRASGIDPALLLAAHDSGQLEALLRPFVSGAPRRPIRPLNGHRLPNSQMPGPIRLRNLLRQAGETPESLWTLYASGELGKLLVHLAASPAGIGR